LSCNTKALNRLKRWQWCNLQEKRSLVVSESDRLQSIITLSLLLPVTLRIYTPWPSVKVRRFSLRVQRVLMIYYSSQQVLSPGFRSRAHSKTAGSKELPASRPSHGPVLHVRITISLLPLLIDNVIGGVILVGNTSTKARSSTPGKRLSMVKITMESRSSGST
jgi:hypothetical protein